jgi:Sec-independent protein translocase protein TatA
VTLDAMWRTVLDSIKNQKTKFQNSKQTITKLESDLAAEKDSIKKMQASTEEINFDSTHISFFGLSFTKSLFVSLVVLIVVGLLIAIGALGARLKLIQQTTNEKSTAVEELTHEFEDYKKRALEKQAKISRELQTERNKLTSFESKGQPKSIL